MLFRSWYTNYFRPHANAASRQTSEILLWAYDEERKPLHGPRMITGEEIAVWWKEAESVIPKADPNDNTVPK